MNEKRKNVCWTSCFYFCFQWLCFSIFTFALLIAVPVGIVSSVVEFKIMH